MHRLMKQISLFLTFLVILMITSCKSEENPFPRPYGFHRIEIPTATEYTLFENTTCPFSFEYPAFGEITRSNPDSCWTDIYFPPFDCKWHLTYRNIPSGGKDYSTHYEEYRRLVYMHTKKASDIRELPYVRQNVMGTVFHLYGDVAIPEQFMISDSTEHIALVSLYFNTALKNDSLAPVISYMKDQLFHMRETFRWK